MDNLKSHKWTSISKNSEVIWSRVGMIFSVMASPNRIDILRNLNSKDPLTYSELKTLAGFKSKKESGKFAHLRNYSQFFGNTFRDYEHNSESVNDILEYHPKNDGVLHKVLMTFVDMALDKRNTMTTAR